MADTQSVVPAGTQVSSVDELQFQRAETASNGPAVQQCLACKRPIVDSYYQAAGHIVCPICAEMIQKGTQAPPASSLARAALFGLGAAALGCAIYATVAIVTGMELGLIAILIGYMVGKAIRNGSRGLGGRPQQILAVVLTYFAITTSYIPVAIYQYSNKPRPTASQQTTPAPSGATTESRPMKPNTAPRPGSLGSLVVLLIALAAAAPFMSLSGGSGILSLVIIFIGLRQAWKLTGRANILVMGPYMVADSAAAG